jgi:predicted DNA repair protein MutK
LHTHAEDEAEEQELLEAFHNPEVDLEAFEKEKIKGAIRTDFILSAEIIVIALGTVADKDILTQTMVVSGVAVAITIGVYGLVAAIVKMDDAGLHLLQNAPEGKRGALQRSLGQGLLSFAPKLMKILTVVGTAAMFLVGGSILLHGIPDAHHIADGAVHAAQTVPMVGGVLGWLTPLMMDALAGIVAGGIVMGAVAAVSRIVRIFKK